MKIAVATSLLFLTACATMTRGPNEKIRIDSNPPGAAASIECDGSVRATGTTPAVLVIPRRAYNCIAQASANGRTKTVGLNRGVSGTFWANFIFSARFSSGATICMEKTITVQFFRPSSRYITRDTCPLIARSAPTSVANRRPRKALSKQHAG